MGRRHAKETRLDPSAYFRTRPLHFAHTRPRSFSATFRLLAHLLDPPLLCDYCITLKSDCCTYRTDDPGHGFSSAPSDRPFEPFIFSVSYVCTRVNLRERSVCENREGSPFLPSLSFSLHFYFSGSLYLRRPNFSARDALSVREQSSPCA